MQNLIWYKDWMWFLTHDLFFLHNDQCSEYACSCTSSLGKRGDNQKEGSMKQFITILCLFKHSVIEYEKLYAWKHNVGGHAVYKYVCMYVDHTRV